MIVGIMKIKQLVHGIPDLKIKGSKEIEITGLDCRFEYGCARQSLHCQKRMRKGRGRVHSPSVSAGAVAILAPFYDPFLKQTQIVHEKPE